MENRIDPPPIKSSSIGLPSKEEPSMNPENKPSMNSGNEPTMNSGNEPSMNSGNEPSMNSGNEPSMNSGNEPSMNSGNEPSMNPEEEPYNPEEESTAPGEEPLEIELLNQGAFGCVYRPNINCDGSRGDDKYVTKIQEESRELTREIEMGEVIRTLPQYEYYFAPLLSSCPVSISSIKESEREKCNLLRGPLVKPMDHFYSTKIRYVGKQELLEYYKSLLKNNPPTTQPTELQNGKPVYPRQNIITQKMYTFFYHCLKGFQKLQERNIVHYDIKKYNIMYDELCQRPIIIDFGVSLDLTQIPKKGEFSKLFYNNEFYSYWCLDILILSVITLEIVEPLILKQRVLEPKTPESSSSTTTTFYTPSTRQGGDPTEPPLSVQNTKEPSLSVQNTKEIQEHNQTVQAENIQAILQEFFSKFKDFVHIKKMDISIPEIENFQKRFEEWLNSFVGKPWDDLFYALFKKEIYQTWDVYSLAITYLEMSNKVNFNKFEDPLSQNMYQLWKSIVLSLPHERRNVEQTIDALQNILKGTFEQPPPKEPENQGKLGFFGL